MVLSTILGSVKLMEKKTEEPSDLAESIAGTVGTREAGIKSLQKNKPQQIMYNTFLAAYKKASKIGENND